MLEVIGIVIEAIGLFGDVPDKWSREAKTVCRWAIAVLVLLAMVLVVCKCSVR